MIRVYKMRGVNEVDLRFYIVVRVEKAFVIIVVIFLLEIIMITLFYIINVLL